MEMLEIYEMSNFYKHFSNRRRLKLYIHICAYFSHLLLFVNFFYMILKIVKIALIHSCLIGLNIQLPAWLTVFFLIWGEGDLS